MEVKDFSNWIKDRTEEYGFTENQDYVCSPVLVSKGRGGNNKIDYHLTIKVAQKGELSKTGQTTIEYFLTLEAGKHIAMLS